MYKALFISALTGSLLLPTSTWAQGQGSKPPAPIQVKADRMEIDAKGGVSIFTGAVVLTQGDMTITADRIQLTRERGEIKRALVDGQPATFNQLARHNQPAVTSQARRMEYDAAAERIHLLEDALLQQGNNRFTGEQIVYDIKAGRVTATQEANMTLQPTSPAKPRE